jgi:hypothetical protein
MSLIRLLIPLLLLSHAATPLLAQRSSRLPSIQIVPGLQLDIITRYTASVQVLAKTSVQEYAEATLSQGFSIGLDAGTGGGKILAGWGNQSGIGGGSFSLGLLRTWNRPERLARNQTFVGPEIRAYLSALGLGGGYYWRVSGPGNGSTHSVDISLAVWFRL